LQYEKSTFKKKMSIVKRWHTGRPERQEPPARAKRITVQEDGPFYKIVREQLGADGNNHYLQELLDKFDVIVALMMTQRYPIPDERGLREAYAEEYGDNAPSSIYKMEAMMWTWKTLWNELPSLIVNDRRNVTTWRGIKDFLDDSRPIFVPITYPDCHGERALVWNRDTNVYNYPGSLGLDLETRRRLGIADDDPVRGTGRDPLNNYGIINNTSYACCGQTLRHPGCWMSLENVDRPQPYRILTLDPWEFLVESDDYNALQDRMRTDIAPGTYYLNYNYFKQLDDTIKETWPAVVQRLIGAYQVYVQQLDEAIDNNRRRPTNPAAMLTANERQTFDKLFRAIQLFNHVHCVYRSISLDDWINEVLFKVPDALAVWTEENRNIIIVNGTRYTLLKTLTRANYSDEIDRVAVFPDNVIPEQIQTRFEELRANLQYAIGASNRIPDDPIFKQPLPEGRLRDAYEMIMDAPRYAFQLANRYRVAENRFLKTRIRTNEHTNAIVEQNTYYRNLREAIDTVKDDNAIEDAVNIMLGAIQRKSSVTKDDVIQLMRGINAPQTQTAIDFVVSLNIPPSIDVDGLTDEDSRRLQTIRDTKTLITNFVNQFLVEADFRARQLQVAQNTTLEDDYRTRLAEITLLPNVIYYRRAMETFQTQDEPFLNELRQRVAQKRDVVPRFRQAVEGVENAVGKRDDFDAAERVYRDVLAEVKQQQARLGIQVQEVLGLETRYRNAAQRHAEIIRQREEAAAAVKPPTTFVIPKDAPPLDDIEFSNLPFAAVFENARRTEHQDILESGVKSAWKQQQIGVKPADILYWNTRARIAAVALAGEGATREGLFQIYDGIPVERINDAANPATDMFGDVGVDDISEYPDAVKTDTSRKPAYDRAVNALESLLTLERDETDGREPIVKRLLEEIRINLAQAQVLSQ
jgi:hypothetical protein